ncbi:DNA-binding response regulator [Rhodoblastus sphagnicola]|uniref:DNA-binding response regulator n=1 Tax=Rhodoblastus sphagnicola TaxID=333368 RepID=A0A2S6N0G9_9HYPH|nr:response regulator [Rhodoblastus sphagnicola]MBB4198569.1 two-component system response regulator FixJ [Rhodoblastus sphagnicola]PPQ28102.1 DNA-binding response regulator [Rhodoblastus sphagnicola]
MVNGPIVHVIEDDSAVRESLDLLLRSAGLTPRLHPCARDFLDCKPEPNGCVVTDIRMADMSGIELLAEMKNRRIALPAVVMTAFADVPLAVKAMKLGAVDFIEKPFDDELMVGSIRAALARNADPDCTDTQIGAARRRLAGLTARERDVLHGLMKGKLNKTIAFELGISVRTVETHRANLMTKTQSESLSELIRLSLLAEETEVG